MELWTRVEDYGGIALVGRSLEMRYCTMCKRMSQTTRWRGSTPRSARLIKLRVLRQRPCILASLVWRILISSARDGRCPQAITQSSSVNVSNDDLHFSRLNELCSPILAPATAPSKPARPYEE
jgi:hypothetical protein